MPKKKTPTTAQTSATTATPRASNQVRQLRRARQWTQWQLAQISRLSERTIQRIENGHRLGVTAELALASAFEVEITALYADAPANKGSETNRDIVKDFRALKRLSTGAALLDVIEAGPVAFDASVFEHGPQRQAVEDFFQYLAVWGMMWQEVEPGERGKAGQVFQTKLAELEACDVYVFGSRGNEQGPDEAGKQESQLVFRRADDPRIIQPRLLRQFGKAMCLITMPVDR